ncbi:MAG TPA: DUF1275 domain-containing protein [Candidatus Ventrimonas merdavium]|nr:DUF1275 domain-containing protein [Candidatus Ventrimonas merdavium]
MRKSKQMSETIRLGVILALSGGFMDAYSYIGRGGVFANAQTGNMLLFGVNLSMGDFRKAIQYFFPVFAFAMGIAVAELVRLKAPGRLHWRQFAVLAEALILAGVAFFPQSLNLPANILTSFACGIQVESFRKIRGNGIATTMCIGNLRSGTQHLCSYFYEKKREDLEHAALYYGLIASFVVGAVLGNFVIQRLHEKAVFCCSALLLLAFGMMFVDYEREKM